MSLLSVPLLIIIIISIISIIITTPGGGAPLYGPRTAASVTSGRRSSATCSGGRAWTWRNGSASHTDTATEAGINPCLSARLMTVYERYDKGPEVSRRCLTHCFLEDVAVPQYLNNDYIGSGNGLVPSGNKPLPGPGNKPLPEPMLTQIRVAIWWHELIHSNGNIVIMFSSAANDKIHVKMMTTWGAVSSN